MIIYFNNLGVETNRLSDDNWVKNDSNIHYIRAYFEDYNLIDYLPTIVFEKPNGEKTNKLIMTNYGEYVELSSMPKGLFEFNGELKATIKLEKGDTVKCTGIFKREIVDSVSADDETFITEEEYDAMQVAINTNATNIATANSNISKIQSGDIIVGRADRDEEGNNIVDTYATKTELTNVNEDLQSSVQSIYDDISYIKNGTTTVKKAQQDKNGNDIVTTYATKAELSTTNTEVERIKSGYTAVGRAYKDNQGNVIVDTYAKKDYVDEVPIKFNLNYNSSNGQLSLIYNYEPLATVDLDTEMIVTDGYFDTSTNEIVLVLANESEIRIPASSLVDTYTGGKTSTINLVVSSDNQILAEINKGSIDETYLTTELKDTLNQSIQISQNETTRQENEAIRQTNEIKRQNNEAIRISNENTRESNEASRVSTFAQIEQGYSSIEQANEQWKNNTMSMIDNYFGEIADLMKELD